MCGTHPGYSLPDGWMGTWSLHGWKMSPGTEARSGEVPRASLLVGWEAAHYWWIVRSYQLVGKGQAAQHWHGGADVASEFSFSSMLWSPCRGDEDRADAAAWKQVCYKQQASCGHAAGFVQPQALILVRLGLTSDMKRALVPAASMLHLAGASLGFTSLEGGNHTHFASAS